MGLGRKAAIDHTLTVYEIARGEGGTPVISHG